MWSNTGLAAVSTRTVGPWLVTLGLLISSADAWVTIDFEDPVLPAGTAQPATGDDQSPYVSQGVTFNRDWNVEFNCCPGGWAISTQADQTTVGFGNAYSAVSLATGGGGYQSSQFAVANNLHQGEATIQFPGPSEVEGVFVTNTTYAYQAIVNGDDGAGFVKGAFTDGDWFRLDVIGLDASANETGRQSIYLADYRAGASSVVDGWTWLDLSALGMNVRSLEFAMESTDVGDFGMNTPAYFAFDNLTFRAVPEPYGVFALCTAAIVAVPAVNRRRRSGRDENRCCV